MTRRDIIHCWLVLIACLTLAIAIARHHKENR
jgi:hypothetical protein